MKSGVRGISKPKAATSMDYNTMVEETRKQRETWKKTAKLSDIEFKNRNSSVS